MTPKNSLGASKPAYLLVAVCLLSVTASASTAYLSYTGTLANPESDVELTFALSSASLVTFQTWGFGGGTNAAGTPIAAGGFDSLIALFSGSGPTAAMVTDGSGDPLADADNLSNPPFSYIGNCPPAGLVAIGVDNDCGDDNMHFNLPAGAYTLVLTDANYIPLAVYDNGTLGEGFSDLTGGVFQTCDPNDGTCITPAGNYAVDIVSSGLAVPEPGTFSLLGGCLAGLAVLKRFQNRRRAPNTNGGSL